ncbi:TIM barrel protein [Candidatus Woesearchaeota archaeon]|nr:TIM barrel protein [Candidatus Woesearchaeota archaeon]
MRKAYPGLMFGTAGIPLSTEVRTTENGIARVKELGLSAMELEFVRQVNIKENKAPSVKKAAIGNGVFLTCHGQYFINLNSLEKAKTEASMDRIFKAARIAYLCGADSMTFHAAYYMNIENQKVYATVKRNLGAVIRRLKDESIDIWIRPETTGKATQFGDVDEIVKLSQDLENVLPCVDFTHLFARSIGKVNSRDDFSEALAKIEKGLGSQALKNMHIHMSGMNYGPKGERNHLVLKESEFNYKAVLESLKGFKAAGVVISESPNIEDDALLMKRTYEKPG